MRRERAGAYLAGLIFEVVVTVVVGVLVIGLAAAFVALFQASL